MSSEFFSVNPATEERIGPFPRLDLEEMQAVAARSRAAQTTWSGVPLSERQAVVRRFIEEFEAMKDKVAADITRQMGKPLSQAQGEIRGMIERASGMLEQSTAALADRRLPPKDNFDRYVRRVPHGVVFNMAAWNYPLLIAVNVVVPAVLAGNSVILKHSARTPLCGDHFADAFRAAGAPADLVLAVQASHQVVQEFLEAGLVDFVAFTGSVPGGRAIQQAASARFVDVGLELGGKDPAYVMENQDDLAWTAANLAEGFLYNCGQSCCAIERVYVHEKVYDPFMEHFLNTARTFVPGDPLQEGTSLGPLVSSGAREHIVAQVQSAVQGGATVALEGGPTDVNGKGFYFRPTVLEVPHNGLDIMQEENFGPIIGVLKVKGDEEALTNMNDSKFGLTASIWGADRARIEPMMTRVRAGTVFMNRCDYLDPGMPWTGYGDSGLGSTLGMEGLQQLTKPQSVHIRIKAGV